MFIITGTIAFDYIMDFPGKFSDHILPEQIHKINLSFIVNKFAKRRGGTAGNVSYSLGLLKTPHILYSYAGKDFAEYKKVFEDLHIDLSHVMVNENDYTATGFAMTDKTDNQIWGYFYGASEKIATLQLNKVASKNDLVLIGPSGAVGSMSLIRQCIALQIPYMFDPGFILTQVTDADLTEGVTNAKYLIGNDYEIDLIAKRVKKFSHLAKQKIVITTLGSKGTNIADHGKIHIVKPATVSKVIDPTGAGDAWRSGFLAGLYRNFSLEQSAQLGSIAAAYAIEECGTQEHRYSLDKFAQRYRQTYDSVLDL